MMFEKRLGQGGEQEGTTGSKVLDTGGCRLLMFPSHEPHVSRGVEPMP